MLQGRRLAYTCTYTLSITGVARRPGLVAPVFYLQELCVPVQWRTEEGVKGVRTLPIGV